ncbi:MAG: 50S ribosomal protein L2 [Promethearchaeota archaeon Loki_b32]|nr:MAG: 50S ribosomal protein L2 [Candidatus Lokiarchaeota archaeon Loki_b32]
MGKRILAQRKGRGVLGFRSPSHRHIGAVKYRPFKKDEKIFKFKILDFIHSPGRGAPVAQIQYKDRTKGLWLPPEGVYVGQEFIQSKTGYGQAVEVGNILPLRKMPIGTLVFNVEVTPMDGGKFARASGVAAIVRNKSKNKVELFFRSKKAKWIHENCLATVGVVAGGGRTDKPFLKAGNKFHYVKSKAKKWPVVRGVAMVAASHPYGGGAKQSPHKPTTTSRNAPPGRKVGQIAARRTGHQN